MPSNLRRLATDHAALQGDNLPPYYLFPSEESRFHAVDDLTQVNVLLTGPPGTPYSEGLWRLHLKVPDDYPKSPPKATFRTRIWHPNVEELSGAVCVDTLKRDWQAKLTLRDVLVTISCLLIYPNPDSALNASAGNLLREDFAAFAHQAKLMTSIHALIPTNLRRAVKEAKHRGEDANSARGEQGKYTNKRPQDRKYPQNDNTRTPIRNPTTTEHNRHQPPSNPQAPLNTTTNGNDNDNDNDNDSENDNPASTGKENDPCLSPKPVHQHPPTPRRSALGKRPLSAITTSHPEDPDADMMLADSETEAEPVPSTVSPSEQNINNRAHSPVRKSPKLTLCKTGNASPRVCDDLNIYEDVPDRTVNDFTRRFSGVGKENCVSDTGGGKDEPQTGRVAVDTGMVAVDAGFNVPATGQPAAMSAPPISSSRSADPSPSKLSKKAASGVSKIPSTKPRPKPRIGIRRL